MSDGERPLADTKGRFTQVVTNGRRINDLEWLTGRILLSNKRLVLASNEGKRQLPLAKITTVKNRKNANQAMAAVSGYFSIQLGSDVFLVAPSEVEDTLTREPACRPTSRGHPSCGHLRIARPPGRTTERDRRGPRLDGYGGVTGAVLGCSGRCIDRCGRSERRSAALAVLASGRRTEEFRHGFAVVVARYDPLDVRAFDVLDERLRDIGGPAGVAVGELVRDGDDAEEGTEQCLRHGKLTA